MKLSELMREAGYESAAGNENPEITSVACDTRDVKNGSLFVCIRGGTVDSHQFIGEAAKRGAVCAVTETGYGISECPIPVVSVRDTREALAYLSDAVYGHPARYLPMIGVTGTNGKTTVSYLLSEILTQSGIENGLIGTVEARSGSRSLDAASADPTAHMTTPDPPTLFRLLSEIRKDGCGATVLEATSHASELKKLAPIFFDLLIFTNLTRDHLDFHGTFEAYCEAKERLFGQTRRALVNLDGSAAFGDPNGYGARIAKYAAQRNAEVFTCSRYAEKAPDFLLADFCQNFETGIRFRLLSRDGTYDFPVASPLIGSYNAMNLLESAVAGLLFGVPVSIVQSALQNFGGIPGRMERVDLGDGADISVLIDFAHTPDALENLLRAVNGIGRESGGRITVLFGCGGNRDRSKRKEMAIAASRYADVIYVTSDNSRSEDPNAIIKDILKGIDKEKPCHVFPERREAIERAVLDAEVGDILLLCGKGHEQYTIDKTGMHDFREAEIVRAAYEKRRQTRITKG